MKFRGGVSRDQCIHSGDRIQHGYSHYECESLCGPVFQSVGTCARGQTCEMTEQGARCIGTPDCPEGQRFCSSNNSCIPNSQFCPNTDRRCSNGGFVPKEGSACCPGEASCTDGSCAAAGSCCSGQTFCHSSGRCIGPGETCPCMETCPDCIATCDLSTGTCKETGLIECSSKCMRPEECCGGCNPCTEFCDTRSRECSTLTNKVKCSDGSCRDSFMGCEISNCNWCTEYYLNGQGCVPKNDDSKVCKDGRCMKEGECPEDCEPACLGECQTCEAVTSPDGSTQNVCAQSQKCLSGKCAGLAEPGSETCPEACQPSCDLCNEKCVLDSNGVGSCQPDLDHKRCTSGRHAGQCVENEIPCN